MNAHERYEIARRLYMEASANLREASRADRAERLARGEERLAKKIPKRKEQ